MQINSDPHRLFEEYLRSKITELGGINRMIF